MPLDKSQSYGVVSGDPTTFFQQNGQDFGPNGEDLTPAPVEPAPVEPAPVEPAPVEPAPVV